MLLIGSPRTFNVFLASPGDLARERKITVQVLDQINLSIRESAVRLELMAREQLPPGIGRPQSLINEYVDRCDLFIGLLYQRWGTPTGQFSSGFEEEFRRAERRTESTQSPEIWVAFKSVAKPQLLDTGPELSKVVAFRRELEQKNSLFYKEFKTSHEWEKLLTSWLTTFAFTKVRNQFEEERNQAYKNTRRSLLLSANNDQSAKLVTLSDRVESLTNSVRKDNDDELGLARVYLAAADIFLEPFTTEVLGTHTSNLLFKHKASVFPSASERNLLMRSMLAEENSFIPVWYWFRSLTDAEVIGLLLQLCTTDRNESVKLGALRLLSEGSISLSKDQIELLPFKDSIGRVRKASFDYVATFGDESAFEKLDSADNEIETTEARKLLVARLKPDELLEELISTQSYRTDLDKSERMAIGSASVDMLRRSFQSENTQLKKAALTELGRRAVFSIADARSLLNDESLEIRRKAYFRLAQDGYILTESDEARLKSSPTFTLLTGFSDSPTPRDMRLAAMRTQGYEVLIKEVNWYEGNGYIAYEALGLDHWPQVREQMRKDLAEGFTRIEMASDHEIEEEYGSPALSRLKESYGDLNEFIRSKFREAAESAIAAAAEATDLPLIETFDVSIRPLLKQRVIRALTLAGGEQHSSRLKSLALSSYGDERRAAASSALKKSSQPRQLAKEFLQERSTLLSSVVLSWMLDQAEFETELFLLLLENEDSDSRLNAVKYCVGCSKSKFSDEEFLDTYLSFKTYYYDVVVWLDRLVSAPGQFQTAFRNQILLT